MCCLAWKMFFKIFHETCESYVTEEKTIQPKLSTYEREKKHYSDQRIRTNFIEQLLEISSAIWIYLCVFF